VDRLPFDVGDVARLHSLAVIVFVALTLVLIRRLRKTKAAPPVPRRARELLAVLVAQAAVGYTQYFTGVPALLVAVHILGAVAVWIATLRLVLSFRTRIARPVAPSAPPGEAGVGSASEQPARERSTLLGSEP
jgi:cytochrome c oxidase assembly protein subunit 15